MVAEVVTRKSKSSESNWRDNESLQEAAEGLVHASYVRGSSDNIGVCVVAF
jgi:serine/threonine protein phosphatase PrpC